MKKRGVTSAAAAAGSGTGSGIGGAAGADGGAGSVAGLAAAAGLAAGPEDTAAGKAITEVRADESTEDVTFDLEGMHVLIAEDIDLNAEILMDILDMEDVTADRAENGEIVVNMFQDCEEGQYNAILMDIRMPVMDGLEATKAIRAMERPDAKTIPIIAMTANAFDEDVQNSLNVGMNAHLSKPVEPDKLYETLGRLVKR